MDILEVAKCVFGVEDLKAEQLLSMQTLLRKQHVICLMPTGYGKSICFQVPAVMSVGFAVVLTPLLALCTDQIATLRDRNLEVLRFDSTVAFSARQEVLQELRSEHSCMKFLYTTPESLGTSTPLLTALRQACEQGKVSLVAVDEAHCISSWGAFRCDHDEII
jgi:superfamily II DNA helicase RecQ